MFDACDEGLAPHTDMPMVGRSIMGSIMSGKRKPTPKSNLPPTFSQTFSNVTLREAKRGSAGVPVAKCEAAGDTQSAQEMMQKL